MKMRRERSARRPAPLLSSDEDWLNVALRLARRGYGTTSPNPMVGAVLAKNGALIGRGWHRCAGQPHAEIEALRDAQARGHDPKGATIYVTLEPCSSYGRTPACTDALLKAGIRRVVVGATDPNPQHRGRAFGILRRAGVTVQRGVLNDACARLNEVFNHWIVHGTPFVTVKAAMTLDGKIATAAGQSKWITGTLARRWGMKLRGGADAILVGINTVLADNPALTFRGPPKRGRATPGKKLRRIILDARARTPLDARVVSDSDAALTTIVVGPDAPARRVIELSRRVQVLTAPVAKAGPATQGTSGELRLDLAWLMRKLGKDEVTSLLVEGGGEVNGSFLLGRLAHRVAFFYAPKILGGRLARRAVAGDGASKLGEVLQLTDLEWRKLGDDWMLQARVV